MADTKSFDYFAEGGLPTEILSTKTAEVQDLERILRGEIAALEAYTQVLEKYSNYEHATELRRIQTEHQKAVDFWKMQLRTQESYIEDSAGPWGAVVGSFVGAAKLLGDSMTLRSLIEGEEHGLSEYQELLESNSINFQSESFIRNICLDQQRRHIASLKALVQNV